MKVASRFELHLLPYVYGQCLWVRTSPAVDFCLRIPPALELPWPPKQAAVPPIFGAFLNGVPSTSPFPPLVGKLRVRGVVTEARSVGRAWIDEQFFAATSAVHPGATWRSSTPWDPVYAVKDGMVVAVVAPIVLHAGDA